MVNDNLNEILHDHSLFKSNFKDSGFPSSANGLLITSLSKSLILPIFLVSL